jgi:hypothetical protein
LCRFDLLRISHQQSLRLWIAAASTHWPPIGLPMISGSTFRHRTIGGRSVEAIFVQVDLLLYREHRSDEHVMWRTDVGFLEPWDAEFYLILGQIGFYDQFTITMNRRLLTVKVSDVETIHDGGPLSMP